MEHLFHERTELLLGAEGIEKLGHAHVFVAGLGGVGSYAAEALARAGVGQLTLLDHDTVAESNLNRQLVALRSTLGQAKAEVMRARIADIAPDAEVTILQTFMNAADPAAVVPNSADIVLDCIDSIAAKAALVAFAVETQRQVFSSMGAGGRIDPTAVRVAKLSETRTCPLAREMRKQLRRHGVALEAVPVVYSLEQPKKGTEHRPVGGNQPGRPRSINGTISYLPAIFGLTLAGEAIRHILNRTAPTADASSLRRDA
ncbi:MAG: ThiF family adenylyltransferase [Thioalkalivibrionaceae bacterium]